MTSSVVLHISPPRQPARPKPTPGRCGPSDELELCGDVDAAADALGNRAAARVERMRSLRRLALVLRAADAGTAAISQPVFGVIADPYGTRFTGVGLDWTALTFALVSFVPAFPVLVA